MGEREFEDITPEGLINRLHTHEPGAQPKHRQGAEPLNTEIIRERFLNAIKEITHLEKALEEKNTALASTAEEKDRLFHALNKAFEDKKRLQDRIADIDIVRNMEIVDFKTGLDKLRDKMDFLLKEKDELIEDIYKRDKTIEELKYTIEKKGLQLTETEAEYINKTEALNNTLAALKTEIDEKTAENVFLRNEISLNQADRNADETSEAEDIGLKPALAVARDTELPREEKAAKELSADKKLLYVKSPQYTESGSQLSEKMIYVAPPKLTDIKKKALGIAILFALSAAGILLAYNLF